MAKSSLAAFCLFLIVLLSAQEMVVQTEAKTCEVLSDKFKGPCVFSADCLTACTGQERLITGRCKSDVRCWCTKNC